MLTAEAKERIKATLDNLSVVLNGFKPRQGQRKMIAIVANTIANAGHEQVADGTARVACIQAGTGVGKTAGYLVGAVPVAIEKGKKVIISTATVALQEQLINRDIPAFSTAYGGIKFAIAKGRGRYVCDAKLSRMSGGSRADSEMEDAAWDRQPTVDEIQQMRVMLDQRAAGSWSGDRDAFGDVINQELWSRVTTDSAGCSGRICHQYNSCPFYRARAALADANVIVTNHDLLMADLIANANILPPPEESVHLIDEAHHLPGKALNAYSAEHSVDATERWLDAMVKYLPKITATVQNQEVLDMASKIAPIANGISGRMSDLSDALSSMDAMSVKSGEPLPQYRFKHGTVPEWMQDIGQIIVSGSTQLTDFLGGIKGIVEDKEATHLPDHVRSRLISDLGSYLGRLDNLIKVWGLMLENEVAGAPIAKWVSVVQHGRNVDFAISACPISAAYILTDALWRRTSGAILASATIKGVGGFSRFLRKTGLNNMPDVHTEEVDSPFDYSRASLIVPPMKSSPKDARAHTEEIITLIPKILGANAAEGSLVLFSSRKQMEEVFRALPPEMAVNVLMQGVLPKAGIISRHCSAIDEGKASIIFGLESFGEGVDLPGRYCTHVIIAKLPFSVPTEPVEEAAAEWLESKGGDYFARAVIPDTSIKLIQRAGRLLRTEEDYGSITILDTRLKSTKYGRQIMDSLPPFTRVLG